MAIADYIGTVQEFYISYYGRPGDPAGVQYWAGQFDQSDNLDDVLAAFGASPEYTSNFGSLTNSELVENLYQQTFGRAADAAGLDFYVNLLDTEAATLGSIAKQIVDGATGDDVTVLANRVAVAEEYTDQVTALGATYTADDIADAQAIIDAVDATAASVTAGIAAADAEVADNVVVSGDTFTLTTGTDAVSGTAGDDAIDGSVVNSFTANDVILDSSTDDNDTLDITLNAANVQATVKNIEDVNVTWTSNNTLALDAVNSTGNTYNLSATALAFTGAATLTDAGFNDVNAGDDITGALTLTNVLDSTIDAGAATSVVLDAGTITTAGQKTMADVTVNGNVTLQNTAADQVDVLTVSASETAKVTLSDGAAGSAIDDSITVAGSNSVTLQGVVTAEKVVNSLDAGTLTVNATDTGVVDVTKIDADLINLVAAATAVTVADNQSLGVVSATGTLTSLVAKAGLTNVTTDLTTDGSIAALDITGISNLNLDVSDTATIALTTAADNNVDVSGAGKLTLNSTGIAAIDASDMTGKLVLNTVADNAVGIIGSSTAVNTVDLSTVATQNATLITGAADDLVTLGAASGVVSVTLGAGDDKLTTGGALTGKATLDAGAGTDTVVVSGVNDVAAAATGASKVGFTGVEQFVAGTGTTFNNVQLSGEDYTFVGTAANDNLVVFAYDKTTTATEATTDLSSLVFSATLGANFSSTTITGLDNVVDTITATALDDTIDAGTKADVIDISQGGADVISIAGTADSTETAMDSITGFNAVATASAADEILFGVASSTVGSVVSTSVTSAVKDGTGAEVVNAETNAGGIMSLSGIDADQINTLGEYIDAAQDLLAVANTAQSVIGFEFDGNTYLVNDGAVAGGTVSDDQVIELVGVTGVSALGAAAAADTVHIA